MGRLAVLRSVSFDKKTSFGSVSHEKIEKYLENKVEYKEFQNTIELYRILQEIYGKGADIEVTNCSYDETYLTQALSINNDKDELHQYIVVIKRLIHDEDTYTFLEFNTNDLTTDVYEYSTVSCDDVISIIRRKSVIPVVNICADGHIQNDEIISLATNDDVGKIITKNTDKEISYVNISNITNINHKKSEEELNQILKEKINAYCCEYFYIQIEMGFCILNCYYRISDEKKNERLTELFQQDIYGDAILFIQSNVNQDSESILNINSDIFNKIHKTITKKEKIRHRNKYFFNLYKEL